MVMTCIFHLKTPLRLMRCLVSFSSFVLGLGQNRFKHSGETISTKFHEVLDCVIIMAGHYLRPTNPNFGLSIRGFVMIESLPTLQRLYWSY